jgi:hypothetical protein
MNSPVLNNLSPTSLRANTTPAAVRGWAVGQILNATVVAFDPDQATATLQVGGQQLQARVNTPVLPGQQLTLRLASTGALPVLEQLQGEAEPPPQPASSSALMTTPQALRTRLPQALPLGEVLTTLARSAEGKTADAAQVATPRVQSTLQTLIQALPTVAELRDPSSLKRAMQGSGLFLEALLAKGSDRDLQAALPRDFKAQLMRLANDLPPRQGGAGTSVAGNAPPMPSTSDARLLTDLIKPSTIRQAVQSAASSLPQVAEEPAPRLGDQVRGGVAQIEVNQLRHLSESAQGNNVWRIDLPVRDVDGQARLLHLEVEEEPPERHPGEELRHWSMRIDLDLEPLGPMHAKVSLVGETVHTVIWAERPSTLDLLQSNVDWLQSQLARVGLDASDVQCLAGRPVSNAQKIADGPLVDVSV